MSFRRIAIVNRGEAAMRCIRAVKAMRTLERIQLDAIALYTDGDRDAPFVRHADRAIRLESPNGAVAAYLDHDLLIEALRATNADAVWPGWGFVAEAPEFVERLRTEGITFLGPSPEAMRAVGDKIAAKHLAEKAQVPVSRWSGGVLEDVAAARRAADQIGYPLVIKASAGGGGRGIRMVESPAELAAAFESAGAEATAAFGDGRLFCEERVVGGRHIEVQIAADLHGFVVSLGSRDCSVQRRHQKVLEEAPPPGMATELRREIEAAAVSIAREVGYAGVGTVEFLLSGNKYVFLEVNPRLQVEHGITEELIGIDLVQLQIRVARGESLADLEIVERGASIEARVCAEDPDQGFIPSPGRIACFNPLVGSGVRVDSGVAAGTTVPADFDSLIAKVIATGATRDEARAKLACALRDFELVIEGGATNKGYLLELLDSDDYRKGGVDTSWLDRWSAARTLSHAGADIALVAAAVLAYQRGRALARLNFYSDPTSLSSERVPPSKGQQLDLSYGSDAYRIDVYAIGSWRYRVHLDGRVVAAAMREEGSHSAQLVIDDRVHRVLYDATEVGVRVELDGQPHRFGWQTLGQVRSSTPAMVVAVHVQPGDRVEAGQSLGLVEAMKMEIGFEAPVSGTITEVIARKGQKVSAGDLLLVIDPGAEDDATGTGAPRLELPLQADPLTLLFASPKREEGELGAPDLSRALAADVQERRAAIDTVRDEVRRVLLGYDANAARGRQLIAFLEEPLPEELPADLVRGLAALRRELPRFVNVERLFIRAPRASVSGELGPSNNARLRVYLRRFRASGAGIAEEFLDLLRAALADYGVRDVEPNDALERAVLRMLASQVEPDLRRDLVQAMIGMLTRLATRVDLTHDSKLEGALGAISGMRGLVPDSLADAAIDARYAIFEGPRMEKRIEPTSKELEAWLSLAESRPTLPPDAVLYEIAVAPQTIFQRVGRWLELPEPARRDIALAAYVQRRYAGDASLDRGALVGDGANVQWIRVPGRGLVLARVSGHTEAESAALGLIEASQEWENPSDTLLALELLLPGVEVGAADGIVRRVSDLLSTQRLNSRFTLELHTDDGYVVCRTYVSTEHGMEVNPRLHDVHPEIAERIDLKRYSDFELERIPGEEGIYTFYGRALEVPDDERIFVLADVPGRFPHAGRELEPILANFERAFHRATSRLRGVLQDRDPRRRLHWNRIVLHVGAAFHLDSEVAASLGERLAPATRHLGLEKLLVGLKVYDREHPDEQPKRLELVFTDPTGHAIEIKWRKPHSAPLHAAHVYERRVVSARSRRLVYPYEIIRMLTTADATSANGDRGDDTRDEEREPLPRGAFEEYDIGDEGGAGAQPLARSVAGRKYGLNKASVVFGVITTPTAKFTAGMRRVLVLSDPTIGMGSLAAPECDRIVAAIDLAEHERIPVEWVPVSSGAKIAMDSGTENLDATARVVRRIVTFTQAGGEIHVIVQGVNVGAQSYFDALSTMLMHTRGVLIMTPGASMVLTGRAALEASGAVSAEDEVAIGGFERIMGPNGEAQYYARNLADAYRTLYEYYDVSYVAPGEKRPRRALTMDSATRSICDFEIEGPDAQGFTSVGEIFDDSTNPGRKRPFPMRAVMAALIDADAGHVERWLRMQGAETAVVWDSHLGGIPVTLIGIESYTIERDGYRPLDGPESWTGGTLFPRSSKKVARAINSASGNRPVVILANLSGFDGSPESLRKLQLEYGAEIARAVVNFDGPILFLVVSRYHGGAYVVFSQALNEGLQASALTGSYASVIGGSAAASVVFARDVRARAASDPRVAAARLRLRLRRATAARAEYEKILEDVTLEHQAALAAEFDQVHSVERAREVGSLNAIFDAATMRPKLIEQLEAALRD